MKKLFIGLVVSLLLVSQGYCADPWDVTIPLGTTSPSDLDTNIPINWAAQDRLLSNYRQGFKIYYSSASALTVGAGEVMVSNSGGTTRLMLNKTSSTTVNWSNLDTGSEAASTTYYVYAGTSTTTDTSPTFYISASSSAPTGVTYYKRLGSFYNNSSSAITYDDIVNDNNYYGLKFGDWVSRTNNTVYQATTDGILTAYGSNASGASTGPRLYSDSNSSPTTLRARDDTAAAGYYATATIAVKKGDYYKADCSNTPTRAIYWLPKDSYE